MSDRIVGGAGNRSCLTIGVHRGPRPCRFVVVYKRWPGIRHSPSHMDRPFLHRHGGFLDGFGQRRVGGAWGWQVRAIASGRAANSIATAASAIMLPASGPTMCTPSTRSVLASARILTKPSVWWLTLARPLAVKGNLPAL